MSDVKAYVGSFVIGAPSQITLIDPDEDGDLEDYSDVVVLYEPKGRDPIQWTVASNTPIKTKGPKNSGTGMPTLVVNTVILEVLPCLPAPGCLGWFLPWFPRRRRRKFDDPIGTGTLSGTMNKPVGGIRLPGRGEGPASRKIVAIKDPLIFYGILA